MKRRKHLGRWLQATSLVAAMALLVSGVSFAALRSQNDQINGSRVSSASADLKTSTDSGGPWLTTMNGYQFDDLMPGAAPMPTTSNNLYLRNNGTTDLQLRLALNPARLDNPSQMNLQKVHLVLVDDKGVILANPTFSSLYDAYTTNTYVSLNASIPARTVQHYQVRAQLDDGAVDSSTQGVLNNIDLVLSGIVPNS